MWNGEGTASSGYRLAAELMRAPDPPTAIFCGNDPTAMGAYEALKERGLRIPEDVAIVGFDNQELIAAHLRPALSTVALPHHEMGRWAVGYLIDRPRAGRRPRRTTPSAAPTSNGGRYELGSRACRPGNGPSEEDPRGKARARKSEARWIKVAAGPR